MTPALVEAVVDHLDRLQRAGRSTGSDDYLVQSRTGTRLSRERVGAIVKQAAELATEQRSAQGLPAMPSVSPHSLRRTSGDGTWRSGDVIAYAAKYVLAGPVTATSTARDAIASLQQAIAEAERLLSRPLLDDLTDPETGEITQVIVVTDNGPCFKGRLFERFIDSRPELTHVRTRRRSPQTNGVIERYHGAIKIELLWRDLPADGLQMALGAATF